MSRLLDDIWYARSADAHVDNNYAPGKVKITKMDPAELRKMLDKKFAYRKRGNYSKGSTYDEKNESKNKEVY